MDNPSVVEEHKIILQWRITLDIYLWEKVPSITTEKLEWIKLQCSVIEVQDKVTMEKYTWLVKNTRFNSFSTTVYLCKTATLKKTTHWFSRPIIA